MWDTVHCICTCISIKDTFLHIRELNTRTCTRRTEIV